MDDSPGVWTAPHALTAAGPGYRRAPTTRPPLSMERPMATNPVSITTKPETTAATESGCGCGGCGCGAAAAATAATRLGRCGRLGLGGDAHRVGGHGTLHR